MADRVPRGPTGVPLFGSSLSFAADPLGFFERSAREYGDFVRVETLNGEIYLLTDPAEIERILTRNNANYRKPDLGGEGLDGLLGEGLLTSEGDRWLRQRKRIQPSFNRSMLDRYAETMVADARELAETWADGDRVEGDRAMSRLTLRIIVETVLGAELGGMEREIADALENVGQKFRSDDVRTLVPEEVPTPRNVKYRLGERRLRRIVRDIIRQHERGVAREDGNMLALLFAAREAGATDITDDQLRDEVLTMLLAGHDTTALTLTYSWYLLSEHPEVRREFQAELDSVLDGEDPTAADADALAYTERVVKEAIRLYPPVYVVYRQATGDDSVAGFRLPEGAIVAMPQWVVHRDPRWWDDPEEFRPERWAEETDRPDYAYYPFGGGPRRCIGEAFAMREAKLILATIGRRFELDYAGRDDPELIPMVTLHPEPPVEFEIRTR
ncbi:cytochrome P450 [Halorussus amylolyticus]|uniref:cytochrome P450 n=1 Tax=Halorussus amylolyticus TaxID=1126242 RepID=UPI00104593AD|nr:cytochrome P450 [Halorussus amylolyticus]